ncbi:DUF2975 domain-containing protein [Fervidibacillus halotolerans]|uniref:DUF2975 domain-containing protein n=1 Tax=Fervidibacillus halotolerans TaxID=2980027 RepID=A0A9E8LZQ2_9BACI|nr:DUF2975 domain-containing protein [Fervidibacillus halotolerans]WAA12687.1 DUF2975 domain-containing protein [Fervidibacillus halotolerans]
MKIARKINFLKVTVYGIGTVVLLLSAFVLPYLANKVAHDFPEYAYLKYPVLIGMYLTTVPFYLALYQAYNLLNLIKQNNAFSEGAVIALRFIKYCAATIGVMYILGMIFLGTQNALHPSIFILGVVILFTCIVISVFAAVLQELLHNAIKIKTENELTI